MLAIHILIWPMEPCTLGVLEVPLAAPARPSLAGL